MRRNLSTLEYTVLGYAWLRGPCTTYAIMKELSQSESTYHQSRAGTAYSIARRLVGFGLLDQDESGSVTISSAGLAELQAWLTPPIPREDVAHSADLLRLRFFFLGAVDQATRLAFIDAAIEDLHAFLKRCRDLLPKNEALGDYYGVLATTSTLLETKARIHWLQLVRNLVVDPLPDENWSAELLGRFPELNFP
ncbi:MAG: hypothetical protein K1X67_10840 [Fimbriimonadaceae bacterium]|nr:hypothetical protein [Fimbriimonadaceae bacterium]